MVDWLCELPISHLTAAFLHNRDYTPRYALLEIMSLYIEYACRIPLLGFTEKSDARS